MKFIWYVLGIMAGFYLGVSAVGVKVPATPVKVFVRDGLSDVVEITVPFGMEPPVADPNKKYHVILKEE